MPYPPYDYYALRDIPDSLQAGYRTGDGLYQQVVDDYMLVVGVDVEPAREGVVERPAKNSKRADWLNYAATQDTGKSREELDEMSRDELIELVTEKGKSEPKTTSRRSSASTTETATDTGA